MVEVTGKSGIVVKILADSVNEAGNHLTTFELTYPRIIHSELLTHKMLCSNSASSRAIPFAKMAEQLTGKPVRFGQANSGMQDKGEDYDALIEGSWLGDATGHEWLEMIDSDEVWKRAKADALDWAGKFYNASYHKQVYNRLTEPFQMMKTVLSGTEFDNFFWLRNDVAADPTLHELARCMSEAREQSVPQLLKAGDWHLPYIETYYENDVQYFTISHTELNEQGEFVSRTIQSLSLEDAIKVSCARTAAVSFRNEDYGLEKCLEVYERLVGDERKHASAMQHQATPMRKSNFSMLRSHMNIPQLSDTWEPGVSHATRDGKLWSAQYCGWVMYRKLIPGENYVRK